MSLLDTLIEMGFPKEKAEMALGSTGSTNLEDAINWIISHPDDEAQKAAPVGATQEQENTEESSVEIIMDESPPSTESKPPQEAKSLKCEDCGKLFRSEDEVQFHAAKSGHVNFSESADEVKPLSEEEKQARMAALQERIKQKRVEKEEEEKKKALELEKQRRTTGQQILATKQRIEEEEMKKIAEDKKRQKKEDALTKQRILEQIKADREAKKREHGGTQTESKPTPPPVAQAHVTQPKKDYDQCQLQIRLLNGTVLKNTFGAKEPLSAVRLFVQIQAPDIKEPFTFMTNFPKRLFTDEDMEGPLSELGLVPAAVLIMSRKP